MVKNISNLGDAAVYCDFGSEVNEKINANVIDYFHHISNLDRGPIFRKSSKNLTIIY